MPMTCSSCPEWTACVDWIAVDEPSPNRVRLTSIGGLIGAAVALGTGLLMLVFVVQRSPRSIFAGAFFVFLGASALGGVLAPNPANSGLRLALLSAAMVGLVVFGLLGLFSVGLPLLVAAAFVIPALAAEWRAHPEVKWMVALPAAVLTIAIVVAGLAATRPPLVECTKGGVVSNAPEEASTMTASAPGGRVLSGTITSGGKTWRFRCVDGELTELVEVP
jgi:hypothetical protein